MILRKFFYLNQVEIKLLDLNGCWVEVFWFTLLKRFAVASLNTLAVSSWADSMMASMCPGTSWNDKYNLLKSYTSLKDISTTWSTRADSISSREKSLALISWLEAPIIVKLHFCNWAAFKAGIIHFDHHTLYFLISFHLRRFIQIFSHYSI